MAVDPNRSLAPAWVPAFNKRVLNPIQGTWAPYLPPWAVIVHTGRKSGNAYRTPVTAFRRGNTIAIPLPYSVNAQWVKNVLAAGSATVIRAGRERTVTDPRVVTDFRSAQVGRFAALMSRRVPVLMLDFA